MKSKLFCEWEWRYMRRYDGVREIQMTDHKIKDAHPGEIIIYDMTEEDEEKEWLVNPQEKKAKAFDVYRWIRN